MSICTKFIVLRSKLCSDWPAIQCLVIGRIPQAWDGNVMPLGDTKTIKRIINKVFVAPSGDIITDYNDLYCLFTSHVALRCVKKLPCLHLWSEKLQTTSTIRSSKLTFESSVANSFNKKTLLHAVSQKRQTVLAKLKLPHFIETALVYSWLCRLLSQVQEIVLRKMCCTHSNIWVKLFWSSVLNTT